MSSLALGNRGADLTSEPLITFSAGQLDYARGSVELSRCNSLLRGVQFESQSNTSS